MIEAKEEPLPHSAFDYSDRVNETARMITEKKRKDGAWICVCVKATDGSRYGFNYLGTTGSPYNSGNAAYFPLGGTAQDFTNGEWVRLERDLQADLTNRFGKTLSSITGIYLWSGGATTPKLWIDDVGFSNSLTVEHNTLGGGSIGHILRHTETNSSSYAQSHRWFHYDQVGSVMAESDASGALAQTHYQDAFGNTQAFWSTGLWGGDKDGWHHGTKEFDISVVLIYNSNRWLNSALGTFTNSTKLPASVESEFLFTEQDPVLFFDNTGDVRQPLGDGWSWDPGIKKPNCSNPNPNNPDDYNEQPHVNDPRGNKYKPGSKLPRNTPQKVLDKLKKKGANYERQLLPSFDPWFVPSWQDLNPANNKLMWIPIGALGGAAVIYVAPATVPIIIEGAAAGGAAGKLITCPP